MTDRHEPYHTDDAPQAYPPGEDYGHYTQSGGHIGRAGHLMDAVRVMFVEQTIVPLGRTTLSGNMRLMTYALVPLVGVVIGLVLMLWINISAMIPITVLPGAIIGLALVYTLQAGLPLVGFGQTADAILAKGPIERKLKIVMASVLRRQALFAVLIAAAVELYALTYLLLFYGRWRTLCAVFFLFLLTRALASLLALMLPPLEPEDDGDMKTLKRVQLILFIVIGVSVLGMIASGFFSVFIALALIALVAFLSLSFFRVRFHGIARAMIRFIVMLTETIGMVSLLIPIGTFLW